MELFKFIGEILASGVNALSDCSEGCEAKARDRMLSIAMKIQTEMPGLSEKPAPWPGQGQT